MTEFEDQINGTYRLELLGNTFLLLPEKAMYWEQERSLIISDVHMGKAGHFRKAGIPVPAKIHIEELFIIDALIANYDPQQIIFLGDLFHSHWNLEWPLFSDWLINYTHIDARLVIGNHDILSKVDYKRSGLAIEDTYQSGPFLFSHERIDDTSFYNFSGHIHPAVKLRGRARQGLSIPCFFFSESYALMPAFGRFTGASRVKINKEDRVFGIAEDQVIEIRYK